MLKQKLLARRGETLTEVLVAILVCGFSITMLVGMIVTSMNINQAARKMDSEFFQALSDAETHTFSGTDVSREVKLTGGVGVSPITLTVRKYTSSDADLTVYGEVTP